MIGKEELRKGFSENHKRYYDTVLFGKEGFVRKRCKECGKYFWSKDPDRELCGEPEHEPYTFIRKSAESVGYAAFWKTFSEFFTDNGHAEIKKYPVVSRWRQDLYFTIASIQDFQRIESGRMSFEYRENPLVVPQICLRFNDMPNVGITGRHLTSFMMAGQHAFDYPKKGYWRDRTIELNYGFLTKRLGVEPASLTYIEDVWAMGDFSEFGPCIESFSKGVELVNSVFTEFEYTDGKIKELPGKVVDVGWGFERMMWYKSGAQTMYDAVFPNVLKYVYKSAGIRPDHEMYAKVAAVAGMVDFSEYSKPGSGEAKLAKLAGMDKKTYDSIIRPHQAAYSIADHMRTLLFAMSDGALPSNVGGGYNLRMMLRRAFDFMDSFGTDVDLMKVVELHIRDLKGLYPDIGDNSDEMGKIIGIERARYRKMKRSSRKIVERMIEKKEPLETRTLRRLYESDGITPDFIYMVGREKNADIKIEDDIYSKIIKSNFVEKKKKRPDFDTEGIEKTKGLFYEFKDRSASKVLKSSGNIIVLDRTPFYPEGGGQEADHGTIDGKRVVDVVSDRGVILHIMDRSYKIATGSGVECIVDTDRRERLMAHHTATHLISASARSVLGRHAWQEGAKKSASKAHIDVAHFEGLSVEQVRKIEAIANDYILKGIKVTVQEMDRGRAEEEFSFSIYQGHGAPASRLRIVEIRDLDGKLIDAEACGGLHVINREHLIGIIKITSTARIHDGVDRIEFVAGKAALNYIDSIEHKIESIAIGANVDSDKIESKVPQLIREMEVYKRRYAEALEHLSGYAAEDIKKNAKSKEIVSKTSYNRMMMRNIATKIANSDDKAVVMLYNEEMDVVCVSGTKSGIPAIEFLKGNVKAISKGVEFKGGGTARIAEGRLFESAKKAK